jgi:hypothetical protein
VSARRPPAWLPCRLDLDTLEELVGPMLLVWAGLLVGAATAIGTAP